MDLHSLIMLQQLTRRSLIRMARSPLAARAFSSASQGPLLSTDDVQQLLDAKDDSVRLVDASWYGHEVQSCAAGNVVDLWLCRYLDKTRNGKTEFQKERLPGAVFFDIETIADKVSTLPHMLPKGSVAASSVKESHCADLRAWMDSGRL